MYPLLESYPKLNLGKRFTEPLLKVICLSVKIPPFSTASGGGIMFAFIVCWIDRFKKEDTGVTFEIVLNGHTCKICSAYIYRHPVLQNVLLECRI